MACKLPSARHLFTQKWLLIDLCNKFKIFGVKKRLPTNFMNQKCNYKPKCIEEIVLLRGLNYWYGLYVHLLQLQHTYTQKKFIILNFNRPSFLSTIFRVNLTATLSGLKLEGEITGLGSSLNYKERVKGLQKGVIVDAQIAGKVKETTIALLEGSPSHQQTVVKVRSNPAAVAQRVNMWIVGEVFGSNLDSTLHHN